MRVQDYLAKISWTAADKVLFVFYGFVALVQMRHLDPSEYGLYALLVNMQTWIFILSDGAALQSVIQFGMDRDKRPGVNAVALTLHTAIVMGLSLLTAALHSPLATLFNTPRFSAVALWLPFYCLLTIPRAYCIKILLRDTQMKQVFWVNFCWFSSMTLTTFWLLAHTRVHVDGLGVLSFDDMLTITLSGMACSSVVAILLSRKLLSFSFKDAPSIRSFLRFGSIQLSIGAITNAIRQLDVVVLQILFHDLFIVGIYSAAKTLYRVFETGMDALFSLLYPSAIRLLPEGRREEFKTLLSKAVSYLFLSYVIIVLAMELGLTNVIIHVLGGRYVNSVVQFNLLALAALFVPFYPLSAALLAMNKNALLLRYVIIASICGLAVFGLSAALNRSTLFPLGVVCYNGILGSLLIRSLQRELGISARSYLRAAPDVFRFLRSRAG